MARFQLSADLATDGYKTGHKFQYNPLTEYIYASFTARSAKYAPVYKPFFDNKVVNFGFQSYAKDYLIDSWNDTFFNVPRDVAVERYRRRMDNYLGKGVVPPDHIGELHDLGYLPIVIKALPEGKRVNIKVPLFTVKNTIPKFFWVPNYIETTLSSDNWKLITHATTCFEYRKIAEYWARKTGCRGFLTKVMMHDFSSRGMSGRYDAAMTGMAHLINFVGTDSLGAIEALEAFYNADSDKELVGCSIPASEHAVQTFEGKAGEFDLIKRMITETYPTGMVSLVLDGFDYYKVLTEYLPLLKDDIENRGKGIDGVHKVVCRPDSGDNVRVVIGYLDEECEYIGLKNGEKTYIEKGSNGANTFNEMEKKGSLEILWDIFGGTVNESGYKLLASCIGLISGEGWSPEKIYKVYELMEKKGFASINLAAGLGSMAANLTTRDCYSMAMKTNWGKVDKVPRNVFKAPKTDGAFKKESAEGLQRVEKEGNNYVMFDKQTEEQEAQGELKEVFRDGKLLVETSLEEIRKNIDEEIEIWLKDRE